jgi:hypothetical protein
MNSQIPLVDLCNAELFVIKPLNEINKAFHALVW